MITFMMARLEFKKRQVFGIKDSKLIQEKCTEKNNKL